MFSILFELYRKIKTLDENKLKNIISILIYF